MNRLTLFSLLIFFSCSKEDSEDTPTETIKYTVSITAGEGGIVSTSGGEYEKGTSLTISATANTGYEFEKWSDDNTENPRTITINSNLLLEAQFRLTEESIAINKVNLLRENVLSIIRGNETVGVWAYSFDFEGDDDLDLLLTRSGELSSPKLPLTIFKNENDQFIKYEPGFDAWGRSVNFFDVNDDGLEDIFLSDHGYDAPPFPGTQDQLIFQNPGGTLSDVTDSKFPIEDTFSHGSSIINLNGKKVILVNIGTTQKTYEYNGNNFTESIDIINPNISEGDGSNYGHPTINGEFRLDIWHEPINALWTSKGDFNGDGYEDLILGTVNRKLAGDYNSDQQMTNFSTDPFGNSIGKSEIILYQNPTVGQVEYTFPESIILDTIMEESDLSFGVIGIVTNDFNNDGCVDYATYITDYQNEHYVSIKINQCDKTFNENQSFLLPHIDYLWEDFELVDIDKDGDMDIIISNNIQWSDTSQNIEEHKVLVNEMGQFTIRNGSKSDIINLPPHVALSWPTE